MLIRRVLLMSTYLLLVIACYSTTKAVRDSLFVTKIGPAQLPYMYLLIAGAMGVVSYVYSKAVNRIGLHRLIRTTSMIAISNLVVFWFVLSGESKVWFYVLYVWVSLFGAITASQCWLLATHVFDAREARRTFAWIGVGGILGGIAGGALTRVVAQSLGTESLILVCAAMMAVTIGILQTVGAVYDRPRSVSGEIAGGHRPPLQELRRSKHLSTLTLFLGIAVVVEAFIDYEYKSVARQFIASKDNLTAFFGTITFYIGIFALLFQTILTGGIFKRFGVGSAVILLPAGLLVASITLAANPVLWAAALLQIIDGALSYSIHRSGMELLFLPVPPETRNAVKGFIDMFVDRLGRAVGGLLLLLLTAVLAVSIPSLSVIVCVLAIVWLLLGIVVKREYLHSFRLALEKKAIEPEALNVGELDHATVETLTNHLSRRDEREILYAIDLLANTNPNRWRSHIQQLIEHPSAAVRARAISVLAQWNDPAVARDEFVRHPDYETARIAMASALALHWTGSATAKALLDKLLRDPASAVARQAIRTVGLVRYEPAIPRLIDALEDKRLRPGARENLLRFGKNVVPELVRRLASEAEPVAIRMRIPKVLALTGTQRAADALMAGLRRFDGPLNHTVLRALNRLRMKYADVVIDRQCVVDLIDKERADYDELHSIHSWMDENPEDEPAYALLQKAIRERLEYKLERIFRLAALIHSPHDIYSVYYNLKAKPSLRPSAVEFLDNLLDADIKPSLIPLIEDLPKQTRFASRENVLHTVAGTSDPWLRDIALYLSPDVEMRRAG